MISDSGIWKAVLFREIRDLRRYLAKTEISRREDAYDRAAVALEKFVFTSAFVVRKLFETKKVSDEVAGASVSGTSFPRNPDTRIQRFNWDRIDHHYNLESASPIRIPARAVCNRLIHSAIFVPDFDEDSPSLTGFYFTSDEQKEKTLYHVNSEEYFSMVEKVIDDDIVWVPANFETGKSVQSNRHRTSREARRIAESLRKPRKSTR